MRVVVTGGGSGGHVYPALAVVEALGRRDSALDARFVGGITGVEARIVPLHGLPFHGVTTRKLGKLVSPGTVFVLFALRKGYREASAFLRDFRPHVVISTGGYVAAATVIAAARQRVPTVVVAPDVVPGRTNLWLARWATRVCVMFEQTIERFPPHRTELTGLPIRSSIVAECSPEEARATFGLAKDRFTVLVTGGSQGAQRLNDIVRGTVARLSSDVQVLHQVGARNELPDRTDRYIPLPYFDDDQMPLAYRAADVTVCRSGVGSLAEATANGLPMLMVPLPTAYADHQTANAEAMARAGAGEVLAQPELTPERLAAEIQALHADTAKREAMAAASRSASRPDAADRIAEIATTLVK